MKISLKLLFLTLFVSFSTMNASKASLLIEPYVGYAIGKQDYSLTANGSATSVSSYLAPNGIAYGARAGLGFGPLYVTGDFSMWSYDGSIPGTTGNITPSHGFLTIGGTVIFSPPVLPFRVWVGYNFIDKNTQTWGSSEYSVTGSSIKFGGSFNLIPLISVNAEYIMSTYGNFSITNVSPTLGMNDVKQNTVLVSVSVPFSVPFL